MQDLPKLTKTERLILEQLVAHPAGKYGLEIVKDSSGSIRRGSVYVLLERMTDRKLVKVDPGKSSPATGGLPRPVYSPTGLGMKVLSAYQLLEANLTAAFN